MNSCSANTGLAQRFRQLFGGLVISFFVSQHAVNAAPVVVNVDHRVAVTYSGLQFDARKGIYTTQVRIRNRSGASMYSPLRVTFDQAALKEVRLLNAQGTGVDGQPYFEFLLPGGMLAAGGMTEPARVTFAVDKDKGRYEGDKRGEKDVKAKGKGDRKGGEGKDALSSFASAHHVTAGVELAPLEPRAEPYALTAGSGKVRVRFSVALVGKASPSTTVYLRRRDDRKGIAMNDQGKDGDLIAGDGIHGVSILVDAGKLKPDACLDYEAFLNVGRVPVVSSPLSLCVSAFPVRVADSSTAKPVVLPDGTKAIADELLITAKPNSRSDAIRRLAADINARVVGSIPPLNLYQLKLSSPVSSSRLSELVTQLYSRAEVKTASVNAIGSYAYTPSDTNYANQHGLQRIRAQDVWDAGATGSGVVVTVLDSGLDKTHADFGTSPGSCQLADNDCGAANTDTTGHGTQVAGVVAARTNNALGVAGVAHGGKIKSIVVNTVSVASMAQGFTDAKTYGLASVINASFSGGPWGSLVNVTSLCDSINKAVLNGATPVAVVVNAAGNNGSNGYYYPARCNVNDAVTHAGQHEALTRKDLFITVANSISKLPIDPLCANAAALDQRCGGTTTGVNNTSNYGSWVDMAAPGMLINTTAMGGGYASPTGTSFSAPMVAGGAAILKSCGAPLDQVESTLRTSANVTVSFPDGSNAPRLDVYRALVQRNRAPTAVVLSSNHINENTNTAGGVEVGTLTATDLDTCDKFTYSIVGGADMGVFSIGGVSSNRLRLTAGVLNFETKPSYSVIVRVTDFAGATFNQTLTVLVNNVNEAPNIANQPFSINENSPSGTVIGTVLASDPDAGDTLTYTITGANLGGFVIDPNTGALSVGGIALDYEGVVPHSYTLTVQVTDAGGLSAPAPATVTVNIGDVNEAPNIANQIFTIGENSANGTPLGTVLASDPDAGNTLSYSITGPNPGGFIIDPNTGGLSVGNSAALDYEAVASHSYTLTVQVTDGLLAGTATITVNVNNVNEAPSIANPTFPAINENSVNGTAVGTVAASDPDAGDTLVYSITGGNTGNAFAIDAATGAITVNDAVAVDFETTPIFSLTVRVTDSTGSFAEATVTIQLIDLPEAIPNPILVFDHKEVGTNYLGEPVDRYRFTVTNWNAYPAAMFVGRPDLPPCGLNTSASRTWVDFYRTSDNSRIYGFCALGTPANLNLIWFGMLPAGTPPPTSVYITLTDRETGIVYTSNSVTVPFP